MLQMHVFAQSCCWHVLLLAGKVELFSAGHYHAVEAVLVDLQLLVLGSVPVARYGKIIQQVMAFSAVLVASNMMRLKFYGVEYY